ncbi:YbjN domain-containing protein [Baaleninema simplex]|uniref:YbjN domain-containing protein n=1 Tax=Baaleninema simplex TaxID=2862350 RepID=UPI00034818BB|nr:YbjN domain-containing protein [Baaleninema simplex]
METALQEVEQVMAQELDRIVEQANDRLTAAIEELSKSTMELMSSPDTTTKSLLAALVLFLTEDDWSFTRIENERAVKLRFSGDNGTWKCIGRVREEDEQLLIYSLAPLKVPPEKRPAIAELLTRANYGMVIGNFEMDYSDGEIRYKTSIDVEGSQLDNALIKQLLYTNLLMMDKYLPAIEAVINGEQTPEEAIALVESDLEDDDDTNETAESS